MSEPIVISDDDEIQITWYKPPSLPALPPPPRPGVKVVYVKRPLQRLPKLVLLPGDEGHSYNPVDVDALLDAHPDAPPEPSRASTSHARASAFYSARFRSRSPSPNEYDNAYEIGSSYQHRSAKLEDTRYSRLRLKDEDEDDLLPMPTNASGDSTRWHHSVQPENDHYAAPPVQKRPKAKKYWLFEKTILGLSTYVPGFKTDTEPFPVASPMFRILNSYHTRTVPRVPLGFQYEENSFILSREIMESPGSINVISQAGPFIAIGSAVPEGGPQGDIRSFNREGALLFYDRSVNGVPQKIDTHHTPWEDAKITGTKYYSVVDIKFDPLRHDHFVTTGLDGTLRLWGIDLEAYPYPAPIQAKGGLYGKETYGSRIPHDIKFRPGTSVFAVGAFDGCVYIHSKSHKSPCRLEINRSLQTCNIVWGHGESENLIFGGAESRDNNTKGATKSFSVRPDGTPALRSSFEREVNTCESLALDITGQRLAVFTHGSDENDGSHIVRLYDLRQSSCNTIHELVLPAFDSQISASNDGTVLSSAFSPDNIYLAYARDDNQTHVYDSRFIQPRQTRRPLHWFKHNDVEGYKYGVTHLEWITQAGCSSPPVLITGGNDGAVRRWDTRLAYGQEGDVLAQLDTCVGTLHLGDVYKREMPLIAGDCDGKIYIYKRGSDDDYIP